MINQLLSWLRNWMLPVDQIDRMLPQTGTIYEIGSGYGSLAYALSNKPGRTVIGVDLDQNKLDKAEVKYRRPNLHFLNSDAADISYKTVDGAVMSDFLHHVDYQTQEIILANLKQKISNKGVLLLKEIDANDGLRKWLSRLWDYILYPKDKIYYRSRSDWKSLLTSLGFEVKVSREVIWFPGSTYLFICSKKSKK